ncbi:Transcriptional regulator, partial [human gut metagenome]
MLPRTPPGSAKTRAKHVVVRDPLLALIAAGKAEDAG